MTDLTDSDVEDVVCGFGNGRLRRGPASASGDIVRSRKRVRVDDEDDGVVGYSYEKAFYEWLVLEPCGMKIERLVKDANILRDLDAHFGIALPDSAATYEELARLALQQNSDKDQSARTFEHLESVPPGRKDETLLIKMVRAKNLWEVERTVDNKGMSKNRVLFCGQPAKITEAAMKTMKVLTTEFVERGFLHGITSADLATRSSKDVFDLLNKLKVRVYPYAEHCTRLSSCSHPSHILLAVPTASGHRTVHDQHVHDRCAEEDGRGQLRRPRREEGPGVLAGQGGGILQEGQRAGNARVLRALGGPTLVGLDADGAGGPGHSRQGAAGRAQGQDVAGAALNGVKGIH